MQIRPGIEVSDAALAELCVRYHVHELSLFGSSARGDFRPGSDVDLLVEFEPGAPVGLLEFAGMQQDLEDLLSVRVDLVPKRGLKPLIRSRVLADARNLYAG